MTLLIDPAHHIASAPDGLAEIRKQECNLAIWQRHPILQPFDFVLAEGLELRLTTELSVLRLRLECTLPDGLTAGEPQKVALIDDICSLAQHFGAILNQSALEVRLEVITTDACRKFHADYVTARLISTYVGRGTQWLDRLDAERVAAGDKPANIQSLVAGDVGIFKGRLATKRPAIHRSPPITGTGEARLLLVLNPVEED
ncbi:DUF1826 domain-containing protein [Aurantiacibacter sp. D1-12]|uniref:DUF1826 domain-containing protein n=1 Tax=Aurantiacibacter sp. D1-12 TaxID=2993658 RepID=UPI00237CF6B7|nr:DUF1826 domain-containing protein [Aurantiacibacter sp. D1-12]MDE1467168.1 DUF1826 domain-containing protein [Aurantiacibacter sp. D1-12]